MTAISPRKAPKPEAVTESDLEWFFGFGQSVVGGGSNFGAMLQRAELYAFSGEPDNDALLSGTESTSKPRKVEASRQPLTARPRSLRQPGEAVEPEHHGLMKLGRVSRALKTLAAEDVVAARAIETYWGDEGARWGVSKYGRLASLIRFVPSGHRLLEAAREKARSVLLKPLPFGPLADRDAEMLASVDTGLRVVIEVLAQESVSKETRTKLLGTALVEARELYSKACTLLTEVSTRKEV